MVNLTCLGVVLFCFDLMGSKINLLLCKGLFPGMGETFELDLTAHGCAPVGLGFNVYQVYRSAGARVARTFDGVIVFMFPAPGISGPASIKTAVSTFHDITVEA